MARSHRRKIRIATKMTLLRLLCSLLQSLHHWSVETQPASLPARLASQPTPTNSCQGIKWVSASGSLQLAPPKASPNRSRQWVQTHAKGPQHPAPAAFQGQPWAPFYSPRQQLTRSSCQQLFTSLCLHPPAAAHPHPPFHLYLRRFSKFRSARPAALRPAPSATRPRDSPFTQARTHGCAYGCGGDGCRHTRMDVHMDVWAMGADTCAWMCIWMCGQWVQTHVHGCAYGCVGDGCRHTRMDVHMDVWATGADTRAWTCTWMCGQWVQTHVHGHAYGCVGNGCKHMPVPVLMDSNEPPSLPYKKEPPLPCKQETNNTATFLQAEDQKRHHHFLTSWRFTARSAAGHVHSFQSRRDPSPRHHA